MKLLLLGDFAGRAIGHTALLAGMLEQLARHDSVAVTVPTLRPRALRAQLPLHLVERITTPSLTPWRGAWGFSGPAVRRLVAAADRVVLVDNQLHDVGYGWPLRNPLRGLSRLLPTLRTHGVELFYLNGGVGPLQHPAAVHRAVSVARTMEVATLRDVASLDAFRELAPDVEARLGGDSGLSMRWSHAEPADAGKTDAAGSGRGRVAFALSPAALKAGHGPGRSDAGAWLIADHPSHRRSARRAARAAGIPGSEVIEPGPLAFEAIAHRLPETTLAVTDRYHVAVMFASAGIPSRAVGASTKALRFTGSLSEGRDGAARQFPEAVEDARRRSEAAVARLLG